MPAKGTTRRSELGEAWAVGVSWPGRRSAGRSLSSRRPAGRGDAGAARRGGCGRRGASRPSGRRAVPDGPGVRRSGGTARPVRALRAALGAGGGSGGSTRRSCVLTPGSSPGGVTVIPADVAPGRRCGAGTRLPDARLRTLAHGSTGAYLDYAATTPMRPEAVAAMEPFLSGTFGNPSGGHAVARAAKTALEEAREEIARAARRAPGRGRVHRRRHRGRQPRGEGRGPGRRVRRWWRRASSPPRSSTRACWPRAIGSEREGFRVDAVGGRRATASSTSTRCSRRARRPTRSWCR